MFVNIIKSYRTIVAICDENLIGKKFEEEKKQLDIKESFYLGEIKNSEEIKQIIRDYSLEDATFNIVGKNSVKLALSVGLVDEKSVGKIAEIPYILILL